MTTRAERSSDKPEHGSGEVATVLSTMANGMFRLQMADGREVAAHTAQNLRKVFTRLLSGDRVMVQLSPFDPNLGRICHLLKSSHPHQ